MVHHLLFSHCCLILCYLFKVFTTQIFSCLFLYSFIMDCFFFLFYHPQCYNKLDLVRNLVSFTVIFLEPRKKSGMYSVFVEPENKWTTLKFFKEREENLGGGGPQVYRTFLIRIYNNFFSLQMQSLLLFLEFLLWIFFPFPWGGRAIIVSGISDQLLDPQMM